MEKEYEEYLIQGQITEVKKSLFNFEGPDPKRYGGIAQLGEHLLCKQGVSGSIPLISTRPKGQIKRVLRIRADGTTNMGS